MASKSSEIYDFQKLNGINYNIWHQRISNMKGGLKQVCSLRSSCSILGGVPLGFYNSKLRSSWIHGKGGRRRAVEGREGVFEFWRRREVVVEGGAGAIVGVLLDAAQVTGGRLRTTTGILYQDTGAVGSRVGGGPPGMAGLGDDRSELGEEGCSGIGREGGPSEGRANL